jgi:DNA-directed RNA polymerase specialized sigma24 family protein
VASHHRYRRAIEVTRATSRRAIPTGELPETATAPDAEHAPDLADALAQLPDKQKQAVAYHYLAGLPYLNVAAVLGGSTDAARRAAADGIAALRRTYPGVATRKGERR